MIDELTVESRHKCTIIRGINDLMMRYGERMLDGDDFNVLYELSTEELMETKQMIREHFKLHAFNHIHLK